MATEIVEFETEDGKRVQVEVALTDEGTGLAGKRLIEKAQVTFEAAIDKIRPIASSLVKRLSDLSPDQITVEFGVKFSAKAGVILAATDTEANLKVSLTWKNGRNQGA